MRIHRRRSRGQQVKKTIVQEYDANQQIRAERLFVITETGAPLGEMSRTEALKAAEERELDLVVVSPKANPPVARIIDHGQFRYEKEKLARKQKARRHFFERRCRTAQRRRPNNLRDRSAPRPIAHRSFEGAGNDKIQGPLGLAAFGGVGARRRGGARRNDAGPGVRARDNGGR